MNHMERSQYSGGWNHWRKSEKAFRIKGNWDPGAEKQRAEKLEIYHESEENIVWKLESVLSCNHRKYFREKKKKTPNLKSGKK